MENFIKIKQIKDAFYSYYRMAGYHKISSSPLIPDNDDSVLFSNSAILPFKKFLHQESPKLFNLQKCIRFRGGKDLLNPEEPPYMSTFDMAGAIVSASQRDVIIEDSKDFMLNILDIPKDRLFVDLSSQDTQLEHFLTEHYNIRLDRLPQDKYNGNFGMDGISGRCAHFSMIYGNGQVHNFGKIIEISSHGRVQNYAFGFGIEKYLYMHDNRENYYESTSIYDLTKDIKSPMAWKYMNTLSAMCYLYSQNINYSLPRYSKHEKIVKSMLFKLAVISELLGISEKRINHDAQIYSQREFNGNVNVDQLIEDLISSKKLNHLNSKKNNLMKQNISLFLSNNER